MLGEGLIKISDPLLSSWYNGPTLLQMINDFSPAKRNVESPFRLSVSDIFKDPHQIGVIIAGKVDTGFVCKGDKILLMPINQLCSVKAIRSSNVLMDYALAGYNVELRISDIDLTSLSIGNVACDPANPIKLTDRMQAQIVTFDIKIPLMNGSNVIYYAQNMSETVIITKLIGICDNLGVIKQKNPRLILSKTTAIVEFQFKKKIPLETYQDSRGFGRFTLRDGGRSLGAGIITKLDF